MAVFYTITDLGFSCLNCKHCLIETVTLKKKKKRQAEGLLSPLLKLEISAFVHCQFHRNVGQTYLSPFQVYRAEYSYLMNRKSMMFGKFGQLSYD